MRPVKSSLAASPMLTHFTRASQAGGALDNLAAILSGGVIRAANRMVRGGRPVVCLIDAPINQLKDLLARRNRRRYEPFGVAIDRGYAFRMGARPVIYLPRHEAERLLPADERWRAVTINLEKRPPTDWTFEREWRIAGNLVLEPRRAVALVETWRDADELFMRFAGRPPCSGVIPLAELFGSP